MQQRHPISICILNQITALSQYNLWLIPCVFHTIVKNNTGAPSTIIFDETNYPIYLLSLTHALLLLNFRHLEKKSLKIIFEAKFIKYLLGVLFFMNWNLHRNLSK